MVNRTHGKGLNLITISLVNNTIFKEDDGSKDEICLFQSKIQVIIEDQQNISSFKRYPFSSTISHSHPDDDSVNALYKDICTYAIGHGISANWEYDDSSSINSVMTDCVPVVDVPNYGFDIFSGDRKLDFPMKEFAGLIAGKNGLDRVQEMNGLYKAWIEEKENEISDSEFREAEISNLEVCKSCANRIDEGIEFLLKPGNSKALRAFQFANESVLLQQISSIKKTRELKFNKNENTLKFESPYEQINIDNVPAGRGYWRPFQIAFIIMTIPSVVSGDNTFREVVDLIWYPTGGGKTEAYLGLSAFSIFMRRLNDSEDVGTDVIMRYTLRLLTAQQFQRASALVCGMEIIRRNNPDLLGDHEITIGIWLGGSFTPNNNDSAVKLLRDLIQGNSRVKNKFIVSKCPWCGGHIGPLPYNEKKNIPDHITKAPGYETRGRSVNIKCYDQHCEFHRGLPIILVDDDIYAKRPSIIIGTVDKFARVSWTPEVRQIFGINMSGERDMSPPNLIIQDELHMIAGPLGSMVGFYETLIEELCTDRRSSNNRLPKIISSTATIRRYSDQVKSLFARDRVILFPPPALSANDSFFSKVALDENGELLNPKKYVGIHAPAFGSLQTTQVRALSAIMQSPMKMDPQDRDPWWTNINYFNSFKELGTTISLYYSDISYYVGRDIPIRDGLDFSEVRSPDNWNIDELTGRLGDEQIPVKLSKLEVEYEEGKYSCLDVCLATSIIEVGVDIDRLSLMSVIGQPKTTAQYIQVTGRIGRQWFERPGVVFTIYNHKSPRERSYYEKFKTFHETIYSKVEPTSITPFALPVMNRALHAIMVGYVRQVSDIEQIKYPKPIPTAKLDEIHEILRARIAKVDPTELDNFELIFDQRLREWEARDNDLWEEKDKTKNPPLITYAGTFVPSGWRDMTWETPTSLRNVDAGCSIKITKNYSRGS